MWKFGLVQVQQLSQVSSGIVVAHIGGTAACPSRTIHRTLQPIYIYSNPYIFDPVAQCAKHVGVSNVALPQ